MKSPDAVRLVVLLGPRFLNGLPPNLLLVLPLLDVLHLLLPLFRLLPHPPCVQPDLPVSLRSENKFMQCFLRSLHTCILHSCTLLQMFWLKTSFYLTIFILKMVRTKHQCLKPVSFFFYDL